MLAKTLIVIGVFIAIFSFLGTIIGIYSSFAGMQNAETAGISTVTSSIETAILSTIFNIVGYLILIIGLVLFYKRKKA